MYHIKRFSKNGEGIYNTYNKQTINLASILKEL